FQNVTGRKAFAGKTGTSRDGWFAGFTPEIVCVVYVGFDESGDLGLTGADSAMPIWADFMKAALDLHPEWNGDWTPPAGLRRAEIDIRNGSLIRELGSGEDAEQAPTPTPTPTPTPSDPDIDLSAWETGFPEPEPEIYVTDVPPEFRRVEWFIGGTVPNRKLLDEEDDLLPEDLLPNDGLPTPSPTMTPIDRTWQEKAETRTAAPANRANTNASPRPPNDAGQ